MNILIYHSSVVRSKKSKDSFGTYLHFHYSVPFLFLLACVKRLVYEKEFGS